MTEQFDPNAMVANWLASRPDTSEFMHANALAIAHVVLDRLRGGRGAYLPMIQSAIENTLEQVERVYYEAHNVGRPMTRVLMLPPGFTFTVDSMRGTFKVHGQPAPRMVGPADAQEARP